MNDKLDMNDKLEMWLLTNSKYFPNNSIPLLQEKLNQLPESKINMLYSVQLKDPTMILIISIFLGALGVDRFLIGDIGLGVGKLLTAGGCGIWWLIDIFISHQKAKEVNVQAIMQALTVYGS